MNNSIHTKMLALSLIAAMSVSTGSAIVESNYTTDLENTASVSYTQQYVAPRDVKAPKVVATGDEVSPKSVGYRVNEGELNPNISYKYKFVTKGSKPGNSGWKDFNSKIVMTVDKAGDWDLYMSAENGKTLVTEKVASCVIDRERPEVYEVAKLSSVPGAKELTLIVDANDRVSGRELLYSFDKGKTWSSDTTKKFTKSATLKIGDIQVKDECGNIAYAQWAFKVVIDSNGARLENTKGYYTKDNMAIDQDAVKYGYVSGVSDDEFAPDLKVTRCQLATMLNAVIDFSSAPAKNEVNYQDVTEDAWYYSYVKNAQKYNLIKTGSKSFYPNKAVTRAELAHALCQFIDLDGVNPGEYELNDIEKSEYKDDIIKIYTCGLMSGYGDGRFGPNDELTRAQVVTVINSIISIEDGALKNGKTFKDVPKTHWAYEHITKASKK